MAELSEGTKFKILLEIEKGATPREICEAFNVPYSKVLKMRKDLNAAKDEGEVQSLVNVEQEIVHRIAEEVRKDFNELSPKEDITEVIEGVVEGIDSYQKLNVKTQESALKVIGRLNAMVDMCVSPIELEVLASSLTKIHTAFFNKNSTNINVLNQTNNTNVSDSAVSKFKSLKRS